MIGRHCGDVTAPMHFFLKGQRDGRHKHPLHFSGINQDVFRIRAKYKRKHLNSIFKPNNENVRIWRVALSEDNNRERVEIFYLKREKRGKVS